MAKLNLTKMSHFILSNRLNQKSPFYLSDQYAHKFRNPFSQDIFTEPNA
jgi:hypothetical protein